MRILKSVARGIAAIDYLASLDKPVRLIDIAQFFKLSSSNASHLMHTLVLSGYVEKTKAKRYRLGSKFAEVSKPDNSLTLEDVINICHKVKPILQALAAASKECAHLAVLVKDKVWYVDKVDSPLTLKVDHAVGTLSPLYCTALGKVFLAFNHNAQAGELSTRTPATIVDAVQLAAEIEATKIRGYAVDNEEYERGIRCVAIPLYNNKRQLVAAVGLSGPAARIPVSRFKDFGKLLLSLTAGAAEGWQAMHGTTTDEKLV